MSTTIARRADAQHRQDVGELHEINRKRERPSYSDMIDRLLAALTRTSGNSSNVALTRNSKGDVQIEVVVRTGEFGMDSIDLARLEASRQFDLLTARYPRASDSAQDAPAS